MYKKRQQTQHNILSETGVCVSLPLWSGKDSQWSKWESSFSTLSVKGKHKGGEFPTRVFAKLNRIININHKKITTTWGTADGGPGRAGKPSILWRRSFFTADVANRDDVILRWYERCSSRGHQCCFVYHAGAVFASRLIRLCSKEEHSISRGIQKGFLFNPHFFFSKQRNKIFTFRIIWLKFNHRWKVFQARHTKTNVRVKATLYSCKKPPLKAGTVNGCKIFL